MSEQNHRLVLAQRPPGVVNESTTRMESQPVTEVSDIVEGLQHAPDALNLLFSAGNTGKVIVEL